MSEESGKNPHESKAENPHQSPDKSSSKIGSKKWFFAKNSKKITSDSQNQVNDVVNVLIDRQEVDNRSTALFDAPTEVNEDIVKPEVSTAFATSLASFLMSLTAITKFPRRQEATSVTEEQTLHELSQASTSHGQKSILREKTMNDIAESSTFIKMRRFWAWYPTNKTKKSIIFVDVNSRLSDSSLESVVTIVGTKPLKSALRRSTGSSGNSSVRFSLPEVLPSAEKNSNTLRTGKWNIVCESSDEEDTGSWISNWSNLRRTRFCKIALCLGFGIIVPSLLVVPVLVYEESSVVLTSAG